MSPAAQRRAEVGRVLSERPTVTLEELAAAVLAAGHPVDGQGLRSDIALLGFRPRQDEGGVIRFVAAPATPAPTSSSARAAASGAMPSWWSAIAERAVHRASAEEGAPARLRDLSPRGRGVALLLAVLLALPFAVGLVRLEADDWIITGDDALLGLRSLDVFSADPPLVGQPSTSETAGGEIRTYHPGPIEMYAFAPLVALLGGWGMVVGAAAANLASILLTAWVILRRAGPNAGLAAVVLLALFERSVGTAVLIDPLSSNMWGIPLVAVLVCCWAVADGDVRLLPVTALFASWAAQQHLAAVAPTVVLVVFALAALGVRRIRAGRRNGADPVLPWLAGSAVVGAVCWLPVAIQQLTGDPGNITAVIEYTGVEGRSTSGLGDALDVAANSLWPVPAILRRGLTGTELLEAPGVGALVLVVVVMAAVGLAAARVVPRRVRLLLGAAMALTAAGLFNASNIPADTAEALRINLHRWIWPASTALVIGVTWGLTHVFRPEVERARRGARGLVGGSRPARRWAATGAVIVAAAVVAVVVVFPGAVTPDQDPYAAGLSQDALAAVQDDLGDVSQVLLIPEGPAAELSVVPALTFALERDGVSVVVPERIEYYWGPQRGADEGWDAAYRISGRAVSPAGPEGELIATLLVDPRLAATLGPLVAAAEATTPVVNAKGDEFLAAGSYGDAVDARMAVGLMATDPAAGLLDPAAVRLMLIGGLDGIDLDQGALQAHLDVLLDGRTVWDQARLLMFRLTDEEAQTILDSQEATEDVPRPR